MKVAILIPCYGDTKAKFTNCLAAMIAHSLTANLQDENGGKIRIQIETFMVSGSMLVESRHNLIYEAMKWGADYALCLDADHTFPHDTFCRLWSHNLPIVGCNYPRRFTPTSPTAATKDGLLYTTQEKAGKGLVEQCAHLGFGVLLINMKVFDTLQAYAEEHMDGNFLPLFQMAGSETKTGTVGEDVYFFRKMAKAGIVPFVDHALSWHVGHIMDVVLTNGHAESQKEAFEEYKRKKNQGHATDLEEDMAEAAI